MSIADRSYVIKSKVATSVHISGARYTQMDIYVIDINYIRGQVNRNPTLYNKNFPNISFVKFYYLGVIKYYFKVILKMLFKEV